MNRVQWLVVIAGLSVALSPVAAQNHATASRPQAEAQSKHRQKTEDAGRGERVFKQNCSRCHDAPQSFPPQISRSIVRHMRVRASLSAQDERALLKFMNP